MTSLLLADYGNSTLKLQHRDGEEIGPVRRLARRSIETDPQLVFPQIAQAFAGIPPVRAVVISCARVTDRPMLQQLIGQLAPGAPVTFVDATQPLPFAIRYESGTPGSDRLAAAMALRTVYKDRPAISVDCGTATNLVAVDAVGDFLGGSIMPGLQLQAESLPGATGGRLPKFLTSTNSAPIHAIGNSTEAALRSGILLGHAGAIEKLATAMRHQLADPNAPVILTGGASILIQSLLHIDGFVAEPQLVLNGLAAFHTWGGLLPAKAP